MLNDPEVIKAAEDYIRVIIRRPHAYFFVEDQFRKQGKDTESVVGSPSGMTLPDGTSAPIPGAYILNADGVAEASAPLLGTGVKDKLLSALRRHKPSKAY